MNTEITRREGGQFGQDFCAAAHPTEPDVWCRRIGDHDAPHRAFTHSISTPEEWT